MLLRTRITAMVAAGLVLAALGWSAAALLREQLLDQRLTAAVQTAQSALWSQVLATHDRELDERMDKLMQLPGFERAVRRRDAAALAALLERAGPAPGPGAAVDVVALLGMGRDPVVLGASPYRELLDADSLERAAVGDSVDGLRIVGSGQAVVLSARRFFGDDGAVLVLARNAQHALLTMAERTGAAVTLLDLRGRLISSTDARLAQVAVDHGAQRSAQRTELQLGDRSYLMSSMPVDDLAGHAAGTLVGLLDHTPDARAHTFLGRLVLAGTVALLAGILLGLNWYLRRSLRPLERSSTRCRRWPKAMPTCTCRPAATMKSGALRAPWPPSATTPWSSQPPAPCASECGGARNACCAPACRCWRRPRISRSRGTWAAATKSSCANWRA